MIKELSMKKSILLAALGAILFTSCDKNLPDVGGTTPEKLANEWWVTFTVDGDDIYGLGHTKLVTYNTAANNNEIWIDDQEHTWEYKVKALADLNNLTFSANQATDQYHGISVNIANGKVLPGAGRSRTGNVSDSIYMEVEFSDDPGTTYVVSGHGRTRFDEDEY